MEGLDRLDQEIALVQEEVHKLQAHLRQLRARRNAHAPLCRLPSEILTHVMDILGVYASKAFRALAFPDRCSYEEGSGVAGWTHLMGTCTRMRSIVLNTPGLWTDVDLNRSYDWLQLCIRNSRSLPLTVCYDEYLLPSSECECTKDNTVWEGWGLPKCLNETINEALPRASSANILLRSYNDVAPYIEDALCQTSLPCLRSLTYVVDDNREIPRSCLDESCGFLIGASRLTHFTLAGTKFSVEGLYLPALVHLEWRDVVIMGSPGSFASFISQSKLLQNLHLDFRYEDAPNRASLPPITLPYMRTLHVETPLSLTLEHLRAFSLPSEQLHVNAKPDASPDTAILGAELFSYMWHMLDTGRSEPIVKITRAPHRLGGGMILEVDHPGAEVPAIIYYAPCPLPDVATVINGVQSIHVMDEGFPQVFDLAAKDPLATLSAVQNVVVSWACTRLPNQGLRMWLQSRADANHRLRVLNICGCKRSLMSCPGGRWERQAVRAMAKEIHDGGLADEVLVEGEVFT
jgi:hypothetical protein